MASFEFLCIGVKHRLEIMYEKPMRYAPRCRATYIEGINSVLDRKAARRVVAILAHGVHHSGHSGVSCSVAHFNTSLFIILKAIKFIFISKIFSF